MFPLFPFTMGIFLSATLCWKCVFDHTEKTFLEFQEKLFTNTFEQCGNCWSLLGLLNLDWVHSKVAMNLLATMSGRLWLKVMYLGIKLETLDMWWLIMIVSLIESRITREINLPTYLWGIFYINLIYVWRPTLSMNVTIPWAVVLSGGGRRPPTKHKHPQSPAGIKGLSHHRPAVLVIWTWKSWCI